MNPSRITYTVARALIGAMFLYTGYIHALDPAGFARAIEAYLILPKELINPVAVTLPWIELATGLSLITGIWVNGGSFLASAMLFVFTAALVASLIRGLDISCGCFTIDPDAARITWWYLLRDLALLSVSLGIFYYEVTIQAADEQWSRRKYLLG